MNNISTFWGFVLKVHSFASPESDTDIIRNVALTGTSDRMHRGMLNSRKPFILHKKEIIMFEKEYWYAVLKDDEDDWYYGNTDLHTAMELAREIGPELS